MPEQLSLINTPVLQQRKIIIEAKELLYGELVHSEKCRIIMCVHYELNTCSVQIFALLFSSICMLPVSTAKNEKIDSKI